MALKLLKITRNSLKIAISYIVFFAVFSFSCSSQKLIIYSRLKFTNLEAIRKTAKKTENVMLLLSMTYGKYATQVPDGLAYKYYECFSSQ